MKGGILKKLFLIIIISIQLIFIGGCGTIYKSIDKRDFKDNIKTEENLDTIPALGDVAAGVLLVAVNPFLCLTIPVFGAIDYFSGALFKEKK